MITLDFLQQRQFVTRKRHPSEIPLEYSDFYDEYIGMKKTGNIVTSKGEIVHTIEDEPIIQENKDAEIIFEEYVEILDDVVREVSKKYKIIVDSEYGIYEAIYDEDEFLTFDIDGYKDYLNQYYWKDFVKNIIIEEFDVCLFDK